MSEYQDYEPSIAMSDEAFYHAASLIVREAFDTVSRKYGDGLNRQQIAEEQGLAYHNLTHSVDVYHKATLMAGRLCLSQRDVAVTAMAAAAHDIYHDGERGIVEARSADWLVERMRSAGFDQSSSHAARLAILGTEPIFTDGVMVGQRVRQLDFPSKQASDIAHTVSCADMAGLCSPFGPLLSRRLYQENQGVVLFDEPVMDIPKLLEHQQAQSDILDSYQYPHELGRKLFDRLRPEIYDYQLRISEALKTGAITTWQELLDSDEAFAETHR